VPSHDAKFLVEFTHDEMHVVIASLMSAVPSKKDTMDVRLMLLTFLLKLGREGYNGLLRKLDAAHTTMRDDDEDSICHEPAPRTRS
jgi:hypothetical protein